MDSQGTGPYCLQMARCLWGCLRCEEGESISLRGVSRLRAGDVKTSSRLAGPDQDFRGIGHVIDRFVHVVNQPFVGTPLSIHSLRDLSESRRVW